MTRHLHRIAAVLAMLVPLTASADPIEVVAAFSLTGPAAELDLPCYRGAEVAVERINEGGGVLGRPLKLVVVDTRSDLPATAERVKQALQAHPGAVAGLGFTDSSYVLAAGPLFQAAGLPFVTPGATDPSLPSRVGDAIFLACYGDDAQARAMASFAYREWKLRRVALWADEGSDYTKTLARYFEEAFTALGGTVVREAHPEGQTDFGSLIEAFERSAPPFDAIYSASTTRDGIAQIEQARAAGLNVPMLSGDGWDDPQIVAPGTNGPAGSIAFTTHRFRGVTSPEMKSFVAAYAARFGAPPKSAFAPLGYDAVDLIAAAMRRAGSVDPDAIRRALAATTDFPGIVGPITYAGGSHVPVKAVEVIRCESGQEQRIWQVTPPPAGAAARLSSSGS